MQGGNSPFWLFGWREWMTQRNIWLFLLSLNYTFCEVFLNITVWQLLPSAEQGYRENFPPRAPLCQVWGHDAVTLVVVVVFIRLIPVGFSETASQGKEVILLCSGMALLAIRLLGEKCFYIKTTVFLMEAFSLSACNYWFHSCTRKPNWICRNSFNFWHFLSCWLYNFSTPLMTF